MARARDLLDFALSREPRTPPVVRTVVADLLLGIVAATAALAVAVYSYRGPAESVLPGATHLLIRGREGISNVPASALVFALVTTLPLALRRIFPITVFWVILLSMAADSGANNVVSIIALIIAAYSAVVHSRFRGAAVMSVLAAGLFITAVFSDTTPPMPGRFSGLLILVLVTLVGNAVQIWRRRVADSAARLQTIQAEHGAATRRALAAERARIAGELHDVVTHNVSVMVVQAGAARQVLAASPADARTALLAVEASGRAAMVELQHLLGLLAPLDGMQADERDREPGETDTLQLRPQPGMHQLRPLVDRVTAAGLPVELVITGVPRALPPGIALTAYRVVQEALTNAMKHAGQARAVVTLHYGDDDLAINVSDNGPGARRLSQQPNGPDSGTSGGRGLLGLRERVSLYGGEFDAGPQPLAGWRVTARLPHAPQSADFDQVRAPVSAVS
jgi:signal transduction histidine kinase